MGTLLLYHSVASTKAEQFFVYLVVGIFEHVEDYTDAGIPAGVDGYLGGTAVGEVEVAGGDAAEGYAVAVVLLGEPEAGAVASGQLLLLPLGRYTVAYLGADCVDDPFCRQIVARSDDGAAGGNLVALEYFVALLAELQASSRVYIVVDARVERIPAPKAAWVGGIDYRIDLEPCDIALPQSFSGTDHNFVAQLHL